MLGRHLLQCGSHERDQVIRLVQHLRFNRDLATQLLDSWFLYMIIYRSALLIAVEQGRSRLVVC